MRKHYIEHAVREMLNEAWKILWEVASSNNKGGTDLLSKDVFENDFKPYFYWVLGTVTANDFKGIEDEFKKARHEFLKAGKRFIKVINKLPPTTPYARLIVRCIDLSIRYADSLNQFFNKSSQNLSKDFFPNENEIIQGKTPRKDDTFVIATAWGLILTRKLLGAPKHFDDKRKGNVQASGANEALTQILELLVKYKFNSEDSKSGPFGTKKTAIFDRMKRFDDVLLPPLASIAKAISNPSEFQKESQKVSGICSGTLSFTVPALLELINQAENYYGASSLFKAAGDLKFDDDYTTFIYNEPSIDWNRPETRRSSFSKNKG